MKAQKILFALLFLALFLGAHIGARATPTANSAGTGAVLMYLPLVYTQEVGGTTTRVSVASDGSESDNTSWYPVLSADGRYVAFYSRASNLVSGDTNDVGDLFVFDQQTGQIERVPGTSDAIQVGPTFIEYAISADGRYLAFSSGDSSLVSNDTNGHRDIFVRDRQTGQPERVSIASDGAQTNGTSGFPSISGDGRFVAFVSDATNLVSGDTSTIDIFVHDRQTGQTEHIAPAPSGVPILFTNTIASLSADGRYIAFGSESTDLVNNDTNGAVDIFVRDRQTGLTERISVASNGSQADRESSAPMISADGRYVAFESQATNLISDDTNNWADIFIHDRQTGQTERISEALDSAEADGPSALPAISADGQHVVFQSDATNLVRGDINDTTDIFVYSRQTSRIHRVSVSDSDRQSDGPSWKSAISSDGRYVAFGSLASNLVAGDFNGQWDIFIRDRGE